jgi:enterochelin esterase-like enzyme
MRVLVPSLAIGLAFSLNLAAQSAPGVQTPPGAPRFLFTPAPAAQPDGTVKFNVFAPAAHAVQIKIESYASFQLTKNDDGMWSGVSAPVAPDMYTYSLQIDGMQVPDPSNPLLRTAIFTGPSSMIDTSNPTDLWEPQGDAHGIVHHEYYRSETLRELRDYYVYTPPGYDPSHLKIRYPVLYLFHGVGDTAEAWTQAGRANFILDNLITSGKAKPMIVVMTLGYGDPDPVHSIPQLFARSMTQQGAIKTIDTFGASLITEIIPRVEQSYRVDRNPASRAIAGLSMGGAEATYIGLKHPELFRYVGSFSGAFVMYGQQSFDKVFSSSELAAAKNKQLLWVACGKQDGLYEINKKLEAWLQAQGIPVTVVDTEGEHTWMVWRRNLIAFAPLLFSSRN